MSFFARMFRFTGLEKDYKPLLGLMAAFALGGLWDRYDTNQMIIYRDKSALYGPRKREGDPPSWPSQDQFLNWIRIVEKAMI